MFAQTEAARLARGRSKREVRDICGPGPRIDRNRPSFLQPIVSSVQTIVTALSYLGYSTNLLLGLQLAGTGWCAQMG